jgi:hypothetical protein
MSNVYCCIKKSVGPFSSNLDCSSYLVCGSWQTLYRYQRDSILLSWTDISKSTTWVNNENGLALLIGSTVPSDCTGLLSHILQEIDTENCHDLLKNIDGRYCLFIVKQGIFYSSVDMLNSTRLYFYENTDYFAYSTSLKALAKAFHLAPDIDGIKQKFIFYTNYYSNLIKGVKFVPYDSSTCHKIGQASDPVQHQLYRLRYKEPAQTLSLQDAADELQKLIGEIIRDLNLSDGVAISLSGGRDSRFTMAELVNVLGNQNIKAFTVGSKRDTEGWFASKICNKFKIAHKTLPPHLTSVSEMEQFTWAIEDFDPGICTHHELLQVLQQAKLPVVDSISTAILLGHVEKGYGDKGYPLNFLNNRSQPETISQVRNADEIVKNSEKEILSAWDALPENIPWYAKVRLLDFYYFQTRWCYWMLKLYDTATSTLPLYTNQRMLNFCLSLPLGHLKDYSLYKFYCKNKLQKWFSVITTRDCKEDFNQQPLNVRIQRRIVGNYWKLMQTEYCVSKTLRLSAHEIKTYISENRDILEGIFISSSIDDVLDKLDALIAYNKLWIKRNRPNCSLHEPLYFCSIIAFIKMIRGQIDLRCAPAKIYDL